MFDIQNIFIEILGYPLSYAELIGTVFGLLCVYWASRENILTWPAGIVNELFLFVIFFQVQLYANMFLQVIFFFSSLYGWYRWKYGETESKVTRLQPRGLLFTALIVITGTFLAGYLISDIHLTLPEYFKEASAYPYADSFVMVISIVATILLAKKKFENWALWVINNVVCIVLYYLQGIYFIALEYLVLLFIASFGLFNWYKKQANG
ncbi:nicotinamide riboside transporter PnuC [Dysgonomonas sp. 521]|uniref:nicotinamide riboside transporter PnuC n=1 Tax=Dysgonomonas sp. 521 TaxID=2302932 RepID=UPI0016281480|nr:nicotinamide riboside transporter PnuC [Dysgonomonas sp. 521]